MTVLQMTDYNILIALTNESYMQVIVALHRMSQYYVHTSHMTAQCMLVDIVCHVYAEYWKLNGIYNN